MKNNSNNKKKNRILWTVIVLFAVALFAASIAAIATDGFTKSGQQTPPPAIDENGNAMDSENVHPLPKKLSFSAQALSAAPKGITITVQATVLPIGADNNKVDWSVEWSGEQPGDISEYLTVLPLADGSTTALVTCYKVFAGEAVITVTTREGGFTAMCFASFVGIPSSLDLTANNADSVSGAIGDYYPLNVGNNYTFKINPRNVVGGVGATCNYTTSVSAHGNIVVQDQRYNGSTDTHTWIDSTEKTIALSSIQRVSSIIDKYFFDCSISNNVLTVNVAAAVQSYYASSKRVGQTATYYQRFKSFENDNWYFMVTITETNTGISTSFKLRPSQSVTGVTLDNNTLIF